MMESKAKTPDRRAILHPFIAEMRVKRRKISPGVVCALAMWRVIEEAST
jgi:hypothetical protein